MRPVVMEGHRVSLGVLLRDDLPTLWKWYNDRNVRRYLSKPHEVFFYENELEWYETIRRNREKEKVFAIITSGEWRLAGVIGLHGIDFMNRNAEVGYIIGPEHWGRGYASEAVKLILEYAFNWLNLIKVYARVFEPNVASIRVLEKNGFKLAGRLRKHQFIPEEGFVDVLIYEKLSGD
ncbi:GNAT family N-acetyltransferase [Thermococcus waiotapuensis]|uniref:GNAT family protein n=1 Tax=Thermococcus waiotapuensis TaxID=90909 RepID=A0AAE4NWC7_9EURY|nr:GNAT family protein [Thermococcus waiotapuensis]MDV3103726.1 GNAT family protein [Thermococcus waiotapuensis]